MDEQVSQDFSMTHGAHQLSFGANWVHSNVNYLSGTNAMGVYSFKATNTGNAFRDLFWEMQPVGLSGPVGGLVPLGRITSGSTWEIPGRSALVFR